MFIFNGYHSVQPLFDAEADVGAGSGTLDTGAGNVGDTSTPSSGENVQTTPNNTPVQPNVPLEIEIDGVGKVKADEIKEWKLGYMRQSDYTKKTQEVARQRDENKRALEVYNFLQANPQIVEMISKGQIDPNANLQNTPINTLNPYNNQIRDLNMKLATIELDSTITNLKTKYADFNEVEVLAEADKRGITDLEFVYNAMKGQRNNEADIRRRIEAELTEKIRKNGLATQTIVSTNDITANANYGLSESELRMAENMGLSPEQYARGKK